MFRLTDNSSFPVFWRMAGQLWTWWIDELAQCCAPAVRLLSRRGKGGVSVSLSKNAVTAPRDTESQAFQTAMDQPSWNGLRQALQAAGRQHQPVILHLGQDLYLSRISSYPSGALAKLDNIVDLDVEKSTPFNHDSALWKWRVLDKSGGQLNVETVILRRNHILTILKLASDAGLEIAEIVAANGGAARPLVLLKLITDADRKRAFWRRVNIALAGFVMALTIAALLTAYQQRQAAYESVSEQVATDRASAVRFRKAQADAQALFESNAVLQREKARTPSLVGIWNALSETLPASVWLTEFQIRGRTGRISGFAKSAAPLIEKLETLEDLSDVSFISPVTINPDDRSERFDISFTLEERHD